MPTVMAHIPDPGPAADIVPITKGDAGTGEANGQLSTTKFSRGLLIATAGDLSIVNSAGTTRTFAVPAGVLPVCGIQRVRSTGTTASGISALYDDAV